MNHSLTRLIGPMTTTVTEDEFPEHIRKITAEQWEEFFDLLLKLRTSNDFGQFIIPEEISGDSISFPYHHHSDLVNNFILKAYELRLIITFDWVIWEEGSKILNNSPMSFHQYDLITLCKLLTMIIRSDRFNDGFLIMNFNDGTIFKIVAGIQGKVL